MKESTTSEKLQFVLSEESASAQSDIDRLYSFITERKLPTDITPESLSAIKIAQVSQPHPTMKGLIDKILANATHDERHIEECIAICCSFLENADETDPVALRLTGLGKAINDKIKIPLKRLESELVKIREDLEKGFGTNIQDRFSEKAEVAGSATSKTKSEAAEMLPIQLAQQNQEDLTSKSRVRHKLQEATSANSHEPSEQKREEGLTTESRTRHKLQNAISASSHNPQEQRRGTVAKLKRTLEEYATEEEREGMVARLKRRLETSATEEEAEFDTPIPQISEPSSALPNIHPQTLTETASPSTTPLSPKHTSSTALPPITKGR